ncbi:integrase [Streptomyces hydrogenans]|uniref:integrase n=1 Tax=Streptomyces TaxID=1883 RepID=UPI00363C6F1F
MLAADINIKIAFDTLGHSDTRIARNIYQSVLPHVGKSTAEATAKLVPLQRKAEQEAQVQQAAEEAKKAQKAKAERKKKARGKKS